MGTAAMQRIRFDPKSSRPRSGCSRCSLDWQPAASESGLKGDLSRVSVLRGAGADATRVDVDVCE